MLMQGNYWCRVVFNTMWMTITYINVLLQACWMCCCLSIVCFGRRFHVLPKCGNQVQEPICFTYDAQFGWGLLPLRQCDGCGQLDHMHLEKIISAHAIGFMKRGYLRK